MYTSLNLGGRALVLPADLAYMVWQILMMMLIVPRTSPKKSDNGGGTFSDRALTNVSWINTLKKGGGQ